MRSLSLSARRLVKILPIFLVMVFIGIIPLVGQAVELGGLNQTATTAGLSQTPTSPEVAAARVISQVISFVGILFLGLMLYAGFLWMTAGGDEKRIDKAKDIILGALIGFLIVVAAYAVTRFIGQSIMGNVVTP